MARPPLYLTVAEVVRQRIKAGAWKPGDRRVPLDQFFVGYRSTALQPGELLLDIRIPRPGPRTGSAFEKIGRRKAMEIAIACAGVLVTLADDGQTCTDVRIGLGSVAPTSLRARAAEGILRGQPLSLPPSTMCAQAQSTAG